MLTSLAFMTCCRLFCEWRCLALASVVMLLGSCLVVPAHAQGTSVENGTRVLALGDDSVNGPVNNAAYVESYSARQGRASFAIPRNMYEEVHASGQTRMSDDERRALRRQINETAREISSRPRRR